MSIEKEIERAVKRTIALDKDTPYKSAAEQEKIISDIKSALNDATFHFENSKSLMLNQSGKKRLVKQYDNLYCGGVRDGRLSNDTHVRIAAENSAGRSEPLERAAV